MFPHLTHRALATRTFLSCPRCRYRGGESEIWVGEWMAARQNRDEIVLATKYTNDYIPAKPGHISSNLRGNGLKSMRLSVEASLQRLQTTYIDLFYLHIWDYTVSIPELMHGLDDLVKAGKILYLGISGEPFFSFRRSSAGAALTRPRPTSCRHARLDRLQSQPIRPRPRPPSILRPPRHVVRRQAGFRARDHPHGFG